MSQNVRPCFSSSLTHLGREREGREGFLFLPFLSSLAAPLPPAPARLRAATDWAWNRGRMSAGPYSGKSSLAAFARVGAVVGGLCYGVVVNGFTGIFGGK